MPKYVRKLHHCWGSDFFLSGLGSCEPHLSRDVAASEMGHPEFGGGFGTHVSEIETWGTWQTTKAEYRGSFAPLRMT